MKGKYIVDLKKKAFVKLNDDACCIKPHVYNSSIYAYNPDELIYYRKSAVHNAIMETIVDMGVGKGLIYDSEGNEEAQDFFDRIVASKLFRNTCWDKKLYNQFSWDVYYNKAGTKITTLQHVPFQYVRVNQYDSFIENFSINRNWYRSNVRQIVPIFNPYNAKTRQVDNVAIPAQPRQLYYYHTYSPGYDIYSAPDYYGAKDYLQIDILLGSFHKGQIENGFFPSVIIEIPGMPIQRYEKIDGVEIEREEWTEFMHNIDAFYSGAENSGKVMYIGKDGESAVTVTKFDTSQNVDLFNSLNEITTQRIISAHRLSSPVLVGYAGSGTLSGNAGEISVAAELFYNTVVIPSIQEPILDSLKEIFRFNGYSDKIAVRQSKPVQFTLSEAILGKMLTVNELRAIVGYAPVDWGNSAPDSAGGFTPFSIAQSLGLEGGPIEESENTKLIKRLFSQLK